MFLSTVFTRTSLKPCFLSPFTLLLASLLSVSQLSLSSLVAGAIKDLRKSNKQWILGKFCGHLVFVCGAELCGKHLRNFLNWFLLCIVVDWHSYIGERERERERERELGFDGTAGDLEESGSRSGRSRVWSRMVVLV